MVMKWKWISIWEKLEKYNMKNIDDLLKKDWYFQGFNAVPAILYGPARSMVYDMPRFLGFGYSACVGYFSHDVCYYLYAWDDLYKIHDELFKHFKNKKNYLNFLLKSDEQICRETLKKYKTLGKSDWTTASKDELFVGWREANDLYAELLRVSHIVEGFSLTTEERIRTLINETFPGNSEALLLLTTPRIHSFISVEHYELCLITRIVRKSKLDNCTVEEILADKAIKNKISLHQKKYYWKLNSYTSAKHLNNNDFAREILELFVKGVDFEKFIQDFEDLSGRLSKKNKLIKKIKNRELLDLLKIADAIFTIHDRRKEHMTQAITYLELILSEIAKRFAIPLEDLHYIRTSELQDLPGIWSELKKRREHSVFILLPEGEVPVLSGLEAKQYFEKIEKNKKVDVVSEIKGNGASPGKVRGIVRVCRGEKELSKMQEGDILVACMTQPEFLPALKKAKAVITDEGGITCHAAIISRELGIPCVIGAKIATKVLQDGDLVEVDANKGVVTIIKKYFK